jgi:hypothetical protein
MRLLAVGLTAFLIVIGLTPVGASSANISHSYHAPSGLASGSIVSLDPTRSDYVLAANIANGERLVGVTVAANESLLAVDPSADTVQVATSGNVDTLVSDLNGSVKVGDQIAVSPFNGVGMKAEAGSHIIGLAQTALTSTSEGVTTQTVTDKNGQTSQIRVGFVRLSISVGTDTSTATGQKLNSLQRLGKSLTGHTLSTLRIAIALAVGLVALVALITLIYASIYGSIISVGRNPLAKFTIFRTLTSVLLMALLTALSAGVTIFFLLR